MVKTAQSDDFGSSIHTQTAYFSDPTHKARSIMDLHVGRTRRAYFTGLPSLPLLIRHFPECVTRGEKRITRSTTTQEHDGKCSGAQKNRYRQGRVPRAITGCGVKGVVVWCWRREGEDGEECAPRKENINAEKPNQLYKPPISVPVRKQNPFISV